jgi:hypothetical protein
MWKMNNGCKENIPTSSIKGKYDQWLNNVISGLKSPSG